MKTFQKFILEAKKYTRTKSREDAAAELDKHHDKHLYRLKNRQTSEMPLWGKELKSKKSGQGKRRSENLKALSHSELEDHAKRNLYPSPKKIANKALKIERGRKGAQRDDARSKTQQTGQKHDVDHVQAQPNRRSEATRSRFQAIHPGDASDNRKVMLGKENRAKNSSNTEKSTTRAGAIRAAAMRALK